MRNTFGHIFTLTTFGESHGTAIGGVVDGMPVGVDVDTEFVRGEMALRRPGRTAISTSREELDEVEFLSGVFEGKSTGTPIGFVVRNTGQRTADYDAYRHVFRPSHADYTYTAKYGIRDYRGGGRASARETVARCVGGALAKLALRAVGIEVTAWTEQVGGVALDKDWRGCDLSLARQNAVRCPDADKAREMEELIRRIKAEGDTIGGIVGCVAHGCPAGLGEPTFSKLHAELGAAMLGIGAAKGIEFGEGFAGVARRGSELNDPFVCRGGSVGTLSNHSGGVQGGISNGQDIYFRVLFKPVATLMRPQSTVDDEGNAVTIQPAGRHDPCVVPRAVAVVEAMAAMTILDHWLLNKTVRM